MPLRFKTYYFKGQFGKKNQVLLCSLLQVLFTLFKKYLSVKVYSKMMLPVIVA